MSNRLTNIVAAFLLIFVFFITLFSMSGDSLTMDEQAHLPAGYSYLTQKDMRLNPEHPPLVKDLAAIPLLFIKGIKFPSEIKAWQEDVNGQWEFGNYFLFKTGNPADKMIFWGRIPMILILILLGFYIFKWSRELFGNRVAICTLFLFSFSPTFLAHGRLVTTDVGAAAGVFIATYYFIRVLKNPSRRNLICAGIALGLAELAKFTTIILLPFFVFVALVWWLFKSKKFLETLKILIAVFVIGYLVVWPVYFYHVAGYPIEKQISDINALHQGRQIPILTELLFKATKIPLLGKLINYLLTKWKYSSFLTDLPTFLISLAKNSVFRPYSQYLTGLFLVIQRGLGGHTTYFLGEVSAAGWKIYFPLVYLLKEPLTFHILTIITLIFAAWSIKQPFWRNTFHRIKEWLESYFNEFAMISFILLYWAFSISSPLNIGVRHLLPVFPFTFLLVSSTIAAWVKPPFSKIKYPILGILILWQMVSVLKIYPSFLAYFNEIAGGPEGGYIYTVDSNLDWGQDLKRLKKWVEANKIEKIYIDYFGGADTKYYFKEKYEPWGGSRDPKELPKGSYLAVSATFLQGGKGTPVPGFNQSHGYYLWLTNYKPVTRIGYSIFVYRIE